MRQSLLLLFLSRLTLFISCSDTVNCERHFLPADFIGKVTIYYNQKDGLKEVDKNGCYVFKINKEGICFSGFPYNQGAANPNETYKFFEVQGKDTVNRIYEFYENEYLKDTVHCRNRKYVFFHSSGYSYPNYYLDYYVDFGKNYKKYFYY